MERKRKYELSALNVLFCLLVIFIHIISYPISEFQTGTFKYNVCMIPWRLSSFVVQGFIMLSGLKLFLNGKDEMPYGKYIKSRLLGVILPYTVCYIVYYAAYMVAYGYPLDVLFILKHYVAGSLVCHLYFIPLLFQFDLLKPLWKKIVDNIPFMIAVPFALLLTVIFENSFTQLVSGIFPKFTFIYNDRLFTTYVGYWLIGCYAGRNYDAFCNMLKSSFRAITIMFLFTLSLNVYVSVLAFNNIMIVPYVNCVHDFYIVFAILFLFAVAVHFSESIMSKNALLRKVDKSSFHIYLYHMLVLLAVNKLLEYTGVVTQGMALVIRIAVVYTVTPALCIIYSYLKNKLKEGSKTNEKA